MERDKQKVDSVGVTPWSQIMQFCCWDYWSGGGPDVWRHTDKKYYRTGFDIDQKRAPFEFNGWGNPAPQAQVEFYRHIQPYIDKILDKALHTTTRR